jgi:hypothetical protein
MQTMFNSFIEENDGVLVGPIRKPLQMLSAQDYAGHASMHDDAAARSFGFRGGAIEGPTHFSQFVPLCIALWGDEWLAKGCLSAHYRSASYEGDELRAYLRRPASDGSVAEIWTERSDGTEILRGTASVGPQSGQTALEARIAKLEPLSQPIILSEVKNRHAGAACACNYGAESGDGAALSVHACRQVEGHNGAFAAVHFRR